jgi:hypothetical protein
MNWNKLIRQGHRWVSIVFTLLVTGLFVAQGFGHQPAEWVFLTPLAPLALLVLTGLHLFVLPYVMGGRQRRAIPE